jgi:hypothetical protein
MVEWPDSEELTADICEKGTNPRRPSTDTTTPPLFAERTCTQIAHNIQHFFSKRQLVREIRKYVIA